MAREGAEDPVPLRTSGGVVEFLADADRPGGWLLLVDRVRQSYVDLDDPSYLDFEYMQWCADVVDELPPGPLAVTHVGGAACTLARYVATTRPGSTQIVLEPDAELVAQVRARLPLPRGARIKIRTVAGAAGIPVLRTASADVVVLDAFAGGRVPAELTTVEFVAELARVLRPDGVLLANLADRELTYARRVIATVRTALPVAVLRSDPAVLKRRRFGNLVLAASRGSLPVSAIARKAAGAPFPQRAVSGAELDALLGSAAPFSGTDVARSPEPPDALWRVS